MYIGAITCIVISLCTVSNEHKSSPLDTREDGPISQRQIRVIAPNRRNGLYPMKNEMRALLAAAAFAVAGIATAEAADIAVMTGYAAKLDADSSALVYYTAAPDGFHVVVTSQQGLTDQAAIARFETVLAAGQSAAVSIPHPVGEAPVRIVLSNAGDHLYIAKPNATVSAR